MPHFTFPSVFRLPVVTRSLMALACFVASLSPASAEATLRMSSGFLARGEQTLLEITVSGAKPSELPSTPSVRGVEIRPVGNGVQNRMLPGRRMKFVFEYIVSSYEVGNHTIPPVTIQTTDGGMTTAPLDFSVFNPDELQWSEVSEGPTRFRYAAMFRTAQTAPFHGQSVPVEIKLYVPRDLAIEDWGIPEFERVGLTCWRFQPSPMRGQANLLGETYLAVAYPSTLTPTSSGKASIGPAKIRLINAPMVMDGFLRRVAYEVYVNAPKLDLDVKPLPPGAPEGFNHAVGQFKLRVSTSVRNLQEGEPIPLDITVSGSGNLDSLKPPLPTQQDGWKFYEASSTTRGDERRELSGSVTFKQFIRATEPKTAVPPFQLVYFDPVSQSYQTAVSEPIPIQLKPSPAGAPIPVGPPPTLSMPVERMTDLLGLLPVSDPLRSARSGPPWELLAHAAAAMAAIGLSLRALWLRFGHRLRRDPVRTRRLAAWRQLANSAPAADAEFLRAAGHFAESELPVPHPPEILALLEQRDDLCFRPNPTEAPLLSPARRKEILATLRQAASRSHLCWLAALTACFIALTSSTATAQQPASPAAPASSESPSPQARDALARQAYESAKYPEAITQWLQLGPYEDLSTATLYHIGLACYRAGSPGHAALYFRRALLRDPSHQESLQNLRFIETHHGSLTVQRPDYQYVLAKHPLAFWKGLLWAGAWCCLLGWLVFPASRSGSRWRIAALAALAFGPPALTVGALGWRYYPNDASFANPIRQAVVVNPDTVVHTDAARTSPQVIDAPPGSLCEIIHQSGSWSYIAFATKTRGWVPTSAIERIIPQSPLRPPKIRKPAADGKSA